MSENIIDEGYVKYESSFTDGPAPDAAAVKLLNRWRKPLYEAGLVGHYDELGVGFGNISVRGARPGEFIISGTQTGHLPATDGRHYALVTHTDIEHNRVSCTGAIQASSEALTHAALYALSERINAVVHVHSRALWDQYRFDLPTTDEAVPYGTPDMAREFARLWRDTDFAATGVAVMAGHDEGLVSVGTTLEEAARKMLDLAQES